MSGAGEAAPPVAAAELTPSLAVLAARSAPAVPAADRLLKVSPVLAELLPERGLRRGSTVAVTTGRAPGATSLTLSLLAPASVAGAWCAVVGLPDLGLVAAAEIGVVLERLALVPDPGEQWPVVTAALLESVDIVVLRPTGKVRAGDARRLTARARERGAVLVILDPAGGARWPEGADVRLEVRASVWSGLGYGHGHLQAREVEVMVTGRRGAARPRSGRVRFAPGCLPVAPSGAPTAGVPAAPAARAG